MDLPYRKLSRKHLSTYQKEALQVRDSGLVQWPIICFLCELDTEQNFSSIERVEKVDLINSQIINSSSWFASHTVSLSPVLPGTCRAGGWRCFVFNSINQGHFYFAGRVYAKWERKNKKEPLSSSLSTLPSLQLSCPTFWVHVAWFGYSAHFPTPF